MSVRWAATVCVAILFASGMAVPAFGADHEPAPMTAAAAEAAVLATVPVVESIRGLTFKQPVSVKVVDDATALQHVTDRIAKFYDEADILAQQEAYIALGLLPEGTDILDSLLDVLEEQAGGFYDPDTKSFFLLDDMPADAAPMLAAHELTHAIEDQYFDIDGRIEAAMPDDDRAFAVSAVHEGTAMLVMTLYILDSMAEGTVTQESLQALGESEAARGEKLGALPPALQRTLLGPYALGMSFVMRGNPGGITAGFPEADADAVSVKGPQSSEQVMHPEKFWDPAQRDDPTTLEPFELRPALGKKWKREASGNLGELVIGIMVGVPTPSGVGAMSMPDGADWTNDAAAGWDGDRWELWRRKDSTLVLLSTVWDSPQDAREFADALDAGAGFGSRVRDDRVAIVAGDAGEHTDTLLDLLLD